MKAIISKAPFIYKVIAVIIACVLAMGVLFACTDKEEEEKPAEEPKIEYKANSPLGIAESYIGEPVQKLQMYFRPEDLPRRQGIMEELPRRFPGLVPTTSVSNNIEINSDQAGKGKALRALCAALGLDPAATLAFGDGSNDTELLRMAGCGVAMGNALEEVKAAADRVTVSSNDGGVAREIRALLGL